MSAKTIPVSEIFYSIEGEGPFVGRPVCFIRTYGCNFTCRGFSNRDLADIEITPDGSMAQVKTDRGCDTIYSWHPEYRRFAKDYSLEELDAAIYEAIVKGVPHNHQIPWDNIVISFTGGEPMMHQKQLAELLESDYSVVFRQGSQCPLILIETNGSVPVGPELSKAIRSYAGTVVFSASPKLSNSGEKWSRAIRPRVISSMYASTAGVYLKFVSDGSLESLSEVNTALLEYNEHLRTIVGGLVPDRIPASSVFLMAEGATLEQQQLTQRAVAEAALAWGYSFSPRAHVWIWGNTVGT